MLFSPKIRCFWRLIYRLPLAVIEAMRKILIVILLILSFQSSFSCGKAYVYKLYPIGFVNSKLIVIETSLDRFWARDVEDSPVKKEERTRWKGVISLKELNENGELKLIEIVDTIEILDNKYIKQIKPFFKKAIIKAKKIPDFEIISDIKIDYCSLKNKCNEIKLLKQSETAIEIEIQTKKYKSYFSEKFIENSLPSGGILNQDFKIQSIRELTFNKVNYLVIHIASGEIHNSNIDLMNTIKETEFTDIRKSIYIEPTLYHGLGLDILIKK